MQTKKTKIVYTCDRCGKILGTKEDQFFTEIIIETFGLPGRKPVKGIRQVREVCTKCEDKISDYIRGKIK